MELSQLKYFKTVAEVGKISAAAEQLFISAPGLSVSISRLEKELGVKLFERTNNQILLNEQGKIFLRYVNQIFNTLECARVELNESNFRQDAHVSIATTITNMWTDLVMEFSKENPDFKMSTTSLRASLISNRDFLSQYTFILAEEKDLPAEIQLDMEGIVLFEDHPVIVVNEKHPLANKKSIKLSELQGENILFPIEDFVLRKQISKLYADCGVSLPNANTATYDINKRMMQEGIGIYFSTEQICKLEKNLHYIPVENPCDPWHMKLYWHKDRVLTAAEEKFKAFVQKFYVPE